MCYFVYDEQQDAQLSQRHRATGWVIVMAESGRLEVGDNIYGLYSTTVTYLASKAIEFG